MSAVSSAGSKVEMLERLLDPRHRTQVCIEMENDMSRHRRQPNPMALASINDETLIRRSTSVYAAPVGEETLMMSIERGRYFGLDDIGSGIWRRLETPLTFGELIDALTADYNADRRVIADDVRKLLEEMAAHDVVRFD